MLPELPSEPAIDRDVLKLVLLEWLEKCPLFMDGSRLFGLGRPGSVVEPVVCLEWVLTRLVVRYRGVSGVAQFVGANLAFLALYMTEDEVQNLDQLVLRIEAFERDSAKARCEQRSADRLERINAHPLYGSW